MSENIAVQKITEEEIEELRKELLPLIGIQFDILSIPESVLINLQPSQVGTINGTLMDACIPSIHTIPTTEGENPLPNIGLEKHAGTLGDREGYPDYLHTSGKRLELKLLFVDNPEVKLMKPATPREASARLTQNVTVKNVLPDKDVLLMIAYQLEESRKRKGYYSPTIIDIGLFPVIDCIKARDDRMIENGGRWFGNYETPTILSKKGRLKLQQGIQPSTDSYGRKESENKDYNEDTNFGKMKRIPYKPLQDFLKRHRINNNPKTEYLDDKVIVEESVIS